MIVPDGDCVFEAVEVIDGVADRVPEREDVCVDDGDNVECADIDTVDVVLNDEPAEGVAVFEGKGSN